MVGNRSIFSYLEYIQYRRLKQNMITYNLRASASSICRPEHMNQKDEGSECGCVTTGSSASSRGIPTPSRTR